MTHHVLGISGSPVRGGNVETFLARGLDFLPKRRVTIETLHLSELQIRDCTHCNFCLKSQTQDRYCALSDDAQGVYEQIQAADILIFATPVYFMRQSALMAALVDRLRVFIFGNLTAGRMKNKIGVSMAVSWLRQGGLETTHVSQLLTFLGLEMIPATVHKGVSPLGASALASEGGTGDFDTQAPLGIESDPEGLKSARFILRRALELADLTRKA